MNNTNIEHTHKHANMLILWVEPANSREDLPSGGKISYPHTIPSAPAFPLEEDLALEVVQVLGWPSAA
jgi:hypothetical protein